MESARPLTTARNALHHEAVTAFEGGASPHRVYINSELSLSDVCLGVVSESCQVLSLRPIAPLQMPSGKMEALVQENGSRIGLELNLAVTNRYKQL